MFALFSVCFCSSFCLFFKYFSDFCLSCLATYPSYATVLTEKMNIKAQLNIIKNNNNNTKQQLLACHRLVHRVQR